MKGRYHEFDFRVCEQPSLDERRETLLAARDIDKAISGIEVRPDEGGFRIIPRVGVLDGNPPPFLEQHPAPLMHG